MMCKALAKSQSMKWLCQKFEGLNMYRVSKVSSPFNKIELRNMYTSNPLFEPILIPDT